MTRFLAALVLAGLLLAAQAGAGTHQLFRSSAWGGSVPHRNYGFIVNGELGPGDVLIFSDGSKFKIGRRLGSGSATLVFELADDPGKVIRIPMALRTEHLEDVASYITSYISGYERLRAAGVPVVRIHQSRAGEYVVVDRLSSSVRTLEDMVRDGGPEPAEREKITRAFVDFARKTAAFSRIGDFRDDQMAYDPERGEWILFDWTSSHRSLRKKMTPFDNFFEYFRKDEYVPNFPRPGLRWISELDAKVKAAIQEQRLSEPYFATGGCRPGVLRRFRDWLVNHLD